MTAQRGMGLAPLALALVAGTALQLAAPARCAAFGPPPSPGTIRMNISNVFSSHAVLQRGKPVVVWGWVARQEAGATGTAAAGPTASVSAEWVDGKTYTGATDASGLFRVFFPAAAARAAPFNLTFTADAGGAGASVVTLAGLLLGDVFLCSGQSNMASVHVGAMRNATAIARAAASLQTGLRIFTSGNIPGYAPTQSPVPLNNLPAKNLYAWQPPLGVAGDDNSTLLATSAACFLMGSTLYTEYPNHVGPGATSPAVPIGLVVSAYGGSSIQAWQSPSSVNGCGDTSGKWPSSVLYNSNVHPFTVGPLAMAGTYWYQGEEDTGTAARSNWYTCALQALIVDWRALFKDAGLFWVVQQLHAYALPASYGHALALQRQARERAAKQTKNKNASVGGSLDAR